MALSVGEKIDRYEIQGVLGEGGMGEVYRAYDERLHRSVALKVLKPPSPEDVFRAKGSTPETDGAARMLREARAAAALEHPNVVAIYDVGEISSPEALRGRRTSRWSSSGGRRSARSFGPARRRSRPGSAGSSKSPWRSPRRTKAGSCIATSSPRT